MGLGAGRQGQGWPVALEAGARGRGPGCMIPSLTDSLMIALRYFRNT